MASARNATEEERNVFVPLARAGEAMSPEAPFPEREEVIGAEDPSEDGPGSEEPMTDEELRHLYAKAKIDFRDNGVVLKKLKSGRRIHQGKVKPNFGFGSRSPPANFTEPPIPSTMPRTKTCGQHPKNFELSRRALVQKLRAADYWLRVLHPPCPQLHPSAPLQPPANHLQVEAASARNVVAEERQEETAGDGRVPRSPLSERRENRPSRLRHLSNSGESTAVDPLWANANRQPAATSTEDVTGERAAQSAEAFDNWWGELLGTDDRESLERFAMGDLSWEPDSFFSTMDV